MWWDTKKRAVTAQKLIRFLQQHALKCVTSLMPHIHLFLTGAKLSKKETFRKIQNQRQVWWSVFAIAHQIISGTVTSTRSERVCVFARQAVWSTDGFVLFHSWREKHTFPFYTTFYSIAFDSLKLGLCLCESERRREVWSRIVEFDGIASLL